MEQVVFIGAHPDDFTGCCGTALRMRGKFGLHIWDFTKGERGLQGQGVPLDECGATREKEEARVAASIGAELHFCGEIDGDAYACRETCQRMAADLKTLNPRAIITHSVADRHADHMMTAVAVLKAIQLAGIHPEVYSMEFSFQSTGFIPKFLVDISSVMEQKIQLIRLYECQNIKDGIVKNKQKTGAFRGEQYGCAYAEAFGSYDFIHDGQRCIFNEL